MIKRKTGNHKERVFFMVAYGGTQCTRFHSLFSLLQILLTFSSNIAIKTLPLFLQNPASSSKSSLTLFTCNLHPVVVSDLQTSGGCCCISSADNNCVHL
ncbi:hypothetical protein Pint_31648 [Pistacia integerrima]|uniref:Uncharacterized protein n=1 Tax=Pistacia integerrima TaxID=434235 RepID=A0ACC0XS69_9ROSI|nr:hypothetical protein Pint_31648 [Pistacia integerrima]